MPEQESRVVQVAAAVTRTERDLIRLAALAHGKDVSTLLRELSVSEAIEDGRKRRADTGAAA